MAPNPYKFIGFGDIHGPKPHKFIGFGDSHGPKPYESTGFDDSHGAGLQGRIPVRRRVLIMGEE